jgi:hypothetical protein
MLKLPEGNSVNSKTLATGHLVAPADHRAIGPQQGEGLAQPTADELGHPAARMDNKNHPVFVYIINNDMMLRSIWGLDI